MPKKMLEISRIANFESPPSARGVAVFNPLVNFRRSFKVLAVAAVVSLPGMVFAAESPGTIDDLGFNSVMNEKLFSSNYEVQSVQSQSLIKSSDGASRGLGLQTSMAFEIQEKPYSSSGLMLSGDSVNEDNGIDIKRFSTALVSSAGTLTVGNDWTNFQDFLHDDDDAAQSPIKRNSLTTEQIRWSTGSGFSVAFENDAALDGELLAGADDPADMPSLVLSWQGADKDQRGRYSFSALGRQLQLDGFGNNDNTQEDLGWGLNLAGGWQFGDLFAALSVTLGNSIDSFILGRLVDRETASSAAKVTQLGESLNISPSLNYRLSETANLHMSLNRFQSSDNDAVHGIDTLDTIHLGYSWNPWPSTRIGIEFIGKEVDGRGELDDSNAVNFAASKRF